MAQKKNPHAVALGRLGGKARAESLSEEEVREIASNAGKARLRTMTAKQRSLIAKKAVAARIAKYGQKKRKESK
jgi:hypothetical protein